MILEIWTDNETKHIETEKFKGAWDKVWHRDNGPAFVMYDNNVKIKEIWCKHGAWHREDGPAYIVYKSHKLLEYESGQQIWYMNNRPLSEDEVEKRKIKLLMQKI